MRKNVGKSAFFFKNIWSIKKKVVPLCPNWGSVEICNPVRVLLITMNGQGNSQSVIRIIGVQLMLALLLVSASGQTADLPQQDKPDNNIFTHLDLGLTLGTDGIAVDLAAPIGDYVQMRLGFAYMPRFEKKVSFQAQIGDTPETRYNPDGTLILDENGNPIKTKFDKMAELMSDLTGYKVDEYIDMMAVPTFWNGKILFDVFPFREKNWFFTAGIYVGPARIARAYNTTEDMPSLMAMSMYNNIYDKVLHEEPIINYNGTGLELPPAICDKFLSYGRMSVPIGYYRGTTEQYRMVPNEEGMVKAEVIANIVRPYVGFGYRLPISKDKRTLFSFNAGVLCWGDPKLVTHDGTDLVHDIEGVKGQVGTYVKIVTAAKVYPILNVTFSRRLF